MGVFGFGGAVPLVLCFLIPLWAEPIGTGIKDDTTRPDVTLTRVAFGSCSKQYLEQRLWRKIVQSEPQLWLWTGDAVYLKEDGVENLAPAYALASSNAGYQSLISTGLIVDGVYDDHDIGRNDAGGSLDHKDESMQAFLSFLGVANDSPRRSRRGAYSCHTFGNANQIVKVIILDTRYHRDLHIIPSVGGIRVPLTSLIACALRWLSSTLGLTELHSGDMLGEEQWQWLEERFQGSEAQVHILVSSVQVFSNNPLFEGWSHFPKAKERLLGMLKRHNPRGLVVVSGDVHHADLIGVPPIEITSSGMTHTLAGPWYGRILELITCFYSSHRYKPDSMYTGLNWGRITLGAGSKFDSETTERETVGVAEVLDEEGVVRLSMPIAADPSRSLGKVGQQSPWTIYGGMSLLEIEISTPLLSGILIAASVAWLTSRFITRCWSRAWAARRASPR